ncbi:MAG: hypothetical protein CR217_07750 [Beijerinckiaceae bacterium]|nr:MAG: hypothetical protein CR217_07750 [Beijerinckiaceae bacterium]
MNQLARPGECALRAASLKREIITWLLRSAQAVFTGSIGPGPKLCAALRGFGIDEISLAPMPLAFA